MGAPATHPIPQRRSRGWRRHGAWWISPTSTRGSGDQPTARRSSRIFDLRIANGRSPCRHGGPARPRWRFGWPAECLERFGQAPRQLFHEDNRATHVADQEGQPGRRPLTYDDVQALSDAMDARAEELRKRGRKGALTAMRNAALRPVILIRTVSAEPTQVLLPVNRVRTAGGSAQVRSFASWAISVGGSITGWMSSSSMPACSRVVMRARRSSRVPTKAKVFISEGRIRSRSSGAMRWR